MGRRRPNVRICRQYAQNVYNSRVAKSRAKLYWEVIALNGLVLTILGLGLVALEIALPTVQQTFSLVKHGTPVSLAILFGVACLSVGLIGWAALLGKAKRAALHVSPSVFLWGSFWSEASWLMAACTLFSSVLDSNGTGDHCCGGSEDDDCP